MPSKGRRMNPIKNRFLNIFRQIKQPFHKISSITILFLTCSGFLLVTEVIQGMSYESSVSFPEEINIGEVLLRTIAVGRGQKFTLRAQSRDLTRMTIVSGYSHSKWQENHTDQLTIYDQNGTRFHTSVTASNYTILFIYWNNSMNINATENNELIFKGEITGLDQDIISVTLFLIGIATICEILNQFQYRLRKIEELIVNDKQENLLFLEETMVKGEKKPSSTRKDIIFLIRREKSTLPRSILFGIFFFAFWIINPANKMILAKPNAIMISLSLLTSWNTFYDNLWILWTGMLLLIGLFYWKSRLDTGELRDYLTLPFHRGYFAIVVLILIIISSLFGLSIPYFITILITYLRFGILPDIGVILTHVALILIWLIIILLFGSIGIPLFRRLPVYSIIALLMTLMLIFFSVARKLLPDLILLLPNDQTSFILQYLENSNNVPMMLFSSSLIYTVLIIGLTLIFLIAIIRFQTEEETGFRLPELLTEKIDERQFQKIKLGIKDFRLFISKQKVSAITICILVFLSLSIGQIAIESLTPAREYNIKSGFNQRIETLTSYEEARVLNYVVLAPGQSGIVNISTTLNSTLKLIQIVFGSDLNTTNFIGYQSNNSSSHFLIVPSVTVYSVYRVYLMNLNDDSVDIIGKIVIKGLNIQYFLIPSILVLTLAIWILFGRFFNLSEKRTLNDTIRIDDDRVITPPSFFARLKLLWRIQGNKFNGYKIAFTAALIWIVIQPLVTITTFNSTSGRYQYYHHMLYAADTVLYLHILLSLFILLIFLAVDSAEVIAGKRSRRDILALFSLPFKRIEWVIVNFFWQLLLYGGLLIYTILLKILLLSLQMKYFYPWIPLIFLIMFLIVILSAWISTGLLFSIKSSSTISTVTKYLLTILILTIITFVAVSNGDSDYAEACGGILGLITMQWIMWRTFDSSWDRRDIQVEGLFVTTLPNVEPFFISIVHTTIWFMVVCLLIVVLLKRLEIN
jgi:hypothetical protein